MRLYSGGRLCLRPVTPEDAYYVVRWRNSEDARKWFFSGDAVITPDSHAAFCRNRKPHDLVWIAENSSYPVGMISLTVDVDAKTAELGRTYIDPEYRRNGLGTEMVKLAMWAAFEWLRLERVRLEVYTDNQVAISLYKKCGFSIPPLNMHPARPGMIDMYFYRESWEETP